MRIGVIALLFIGLTQVVFAQKSNKLQTSISLDGKTLVDGDFVDIYSFNELTIESNIKHDSIYDHLEIQFVIVPFNATVLVFKAEKNTIRTIDIDQHLSLVPMVTKDISHVILNVLYDEIPQSTVTIYTRKIESAEDHFQEFNSHAGAGNAENANWYLEQAIYLDPDNQQYKLAQAQFYWETGDAETAFRLLDGMLETHPTYEALNYLGYIYINLNNLDKAQEIYLRAMDFAKTDSEKSDAHTSLGNVARLKYDYPTAYEQYHTALDFNPLSIGALNNIASVCDEVNKADEKVGYFQRIIDTDSSFYLVHVNIGFHYLGEEKYQEALEEFEAVLEVDSTQAHTLNNKSFALLKLNRFDEAMTFVNKSLSYGPNNAYAYRNRALIKLEMGKKQSACEDLFKAKELKFTEEYGNEVLDLIQKHCK